MAEQYFVTERWNSNGGTIRTSELMNAEQAWDLAAEWILERRPDLTLQQENEQYEKHLYGAFHFAAFGLDDHEYNTGDTTVSIIERD